LLLFFPAWRLVSENYTPAIAYPDNPNKHWEEDRSGQLLIPLSKRFVLRLLQKCIGSSERKPNMAAVERLFQIHVELWQQKTRCWGDSLVVGKSWITAARSIFSDTQKAISKRHYLVLKTTPGGRNSQSVLWVYSRYWGMCWREFTSICNLPTLLLLNSTKKAPQKFQQNHFSYMMSSVSLKLVM